MALSAGYPDVQSTTAYARAFELYHHTLEQQRTVAEEALDCAQAAGDSKRESICRRELYNLLLVDAPLERDLVNREHPSPPAPPSQPTFQWPLRQASRVASLMEQVNAMPSGQDWLEVTAGKLRAPRCPPDCRPASFKQQLGEAIQNHESTLAAQEGRKARKFNYSRWIFRA